MGLLDRVRYSITKRLPLRFKFARIYRLGGFGGTAESVSGVGSTIETTSDLRIALERLIRELHVGALLDAPCGDFHWMEQVDLACVAYHGIDIVPELVRENLKRFGSERRRFSCGDLRTCELPAAEIVLCRDCLVHLSEDDCWMVLQNLLRTHASWFLLTTFPDLSSNRDLASGMGWRPLNLERTPFCLPAPQAVLIETEADALAGPKRLGLWGYEQVAQAIEMRRATLER